MGDATDIPADPVSNAGPASAVWGDDAPSEWSRLASLPPTFSDSGLLLASPSSVDFALHEPNLFSSGPDAGFLGSETGLIPLQVDPPAHADYRRMLDRLFSPKRMVALEESIADLANTCIDRFVARGECNFSVEFANPFPAGTFLRLLGLPLAGLDEFLRMKDDVIRPGGADADAANQTRLRAGAEISALFEGALAEREVESRDDLLSHFVALERQGDLRREESVNISYLLLLAGLDTVSGTLECAFALLARRPDLQRVMADPESIGPAVEELLRWIVTSPAQARVLTDDVTLEGVHIPKGTKITALQATINFDPARFPDPLTLDVQRSPNRHATFGVGVHRCLGSHLARIELAVALREWHRRIPSYRLPDGYHVTYTPALRGVANLQLQFAT